MDLKKIIMWVLYPPLAFHEILWMVLFSLKHRDLIPPKFFLFIFFLWIFKYALKNTLTAPRPKHVAKKQSFMCLSLSVSQTPHFLWISWSAKCDSSSCFWKLYIYIFSFYMTTCFLLHHPRCSEFCHHFKKLHYKIKEQWIRRKKQLLVRHHH